MKHSLLVGLAFLWVSWAMPTPAEACSCTESRPEENAKGAERVFLAKVEGHKSIASGYRTTMSVLEVFKGNVPKVFTWDHPNLGPLCGPEYQAGQLTVVYESKGGYIGLCSGNWHLGQQLEELPAALAALGSLRKVENIPASLLELALTDVLGGYTHKRKTLTVQTSFPPKGGFRLNETRVRFRKTRKKSRAAGVEVDGIHNAGALWIVSGHYRSEGLRFHALVKEDESGKLILLGKSVSER